MLQEKLLEGTITVKELMEHGNYGIGTGQGINGELIILDGTAYHIPSQSKPTIADPEMTVPFANVHQGDFHFFGTYQDINVSELLRDVKQKIRGGNYFFSVLIKGHFKDVKTRSADGAKKPYPSLSKIAEGQHEFEKEDVDGQFIAYHAPKVFQGVTVAGFHGHFIDDAHDMGGHALSANIDKANVYVQKIDYFEEHLPLDNDDFVKANLEKLDDLNSAIEKAEG